MRLRNIILNVIVIGLIIFGLIFSLFLFLIWLRMTPVKQKDYSKWSIQDKAFVEAELETRLPLSFKLLYFHQGGFQDYFVHMAFTVKKQDFIDMMPPDIISTSESYVDCGYHKCLDYSNKAIRKVSSIKDSIESARHILDTEYKIDKKGKDIVVDGLFILSEDWDSLKDSDEITVILFFFQV